MTDYVNVPKIIGLALSTNKVSWWELEEKMSLEDVYDLLEIVAVNNYNQRQVDKYLEAKRAT